ISAKSEARTGNPAARYSYSLTGLLLLLELGPQGLDRLARAGPLRLEEGNGLFVVAHPDLLDAAKYPEDTEITGGRKREEEVIGERRRGLVGAALLCSLFCGLCGFFLPVALIHTVCAAVARRSCRETSLRTWVSWVNPDRLVMLAARPSTTGRPKQCARC